MAMVEEVASQCRARRLLIVANPSGSSSDDDTPLGSYYNGYSIAPSPPGAPLLREVTSPLPTSSNRPLAEYDGPSSSELYRPPHLPQTPQHMTSLPAPASIRYTQLARQQRPQSSSDSLLPSLRPLKKKIPLSSPQPIMPVTDTQPARPVPKENLALSVASDDSTWSPLVQRTATRSKRLPLRTDGSRPSSHPDPNPSSTQGNSISGTFMPPITRHFSLLKSASAPVKSGSKIWLQVEEIYETLDQLFPNHDVNTPITDIPSGATWSVTWAPLVIRVFDALLHLFAFSRDSLNRPLVLPNNRGVYTRRVGTKVQQPSVDDYATHVDSNPATPQPDTTASALNILHRDITRPNTMSTDEMFQCLTHHGCPDLTESMDPNAYSRHYIAPGGFGDIWKSELHDGTAVAIEVWRFRALDEDPGEDIKRAMREIYYWSQLNHENIQKLLGVIVFEGRLGMVSKWMEEGNLQNYLENNPRVDRYPLCIQTAQGVEYLHYRNMIHGDLKALGALLLARNVD
ncbi:hypothetical protein ACGC1H_005343 [Rhizoctonia solani]